MGLALSTAWNSFRSTSVQELLSEIKDIGFDCVELGFSLTPLMVKDIESFADKAGIKAVSVHNFCPIPLGLSKKRALPDCYSMSSSDEEERQLAVKYTKITIDTANRLNARAVVLHCGRVEVPERTKKLAALLSAGKKGTKQYNRLKDGMLKERRTRHKPYLNNTLRSLEELCQYAQKMNVSLGIENRIYVREIPSFEEMGIVLNKFKGAPVFYWHDTGHAQVQENLGFATHKEYLDSFADNIIGAHLHNCTLTRDHQAPYRGEIDTFGDPAFCGVALSVNTEETQESYIQKASPDACHQGIRSVDFAMLVPYINKQTIKVVEAHHPATAKDLAESKRILEEIFNGRP